MRHFLATARTPSPLSGCVFESPTPGPLVSCAGAPKAVAALQPGAPPLAIPVASITPAADPHLPVTSRAVEQAVPVRDHRDPARRWAGQRSRLAA
jgi:hypothetical protein